MTVPDEAVEAYRAGYGRSFRKENRTDRDDVRAGLTAAAPLIVEHYLRSRIREAEPDPDDARLWEHIAEMSRASALRTAMVDVLRSLADAIDEAADRRDAHLEQAAVRVGSRLARERADELERGGDR